MSAAAPPERRKGRILVVDDTPDNLHLLMALLTRQGYAVHPCTEGALALQFIESTIPDVVLLDVRMPGLDGYEVCARLKDDPRTRDVPVIFLSAAGHVFDKVKGFRCGAVDYISKPFEAEEVLARIETHISLRRLRADLEAAVRERTAELMRANARLQEEIVEREHAEEAQRKSAEEIGRLYNEAPCGYHSTSLTGDFVRINDTELRWLGYLRQEVIGKLNVADVLTPSSLEVYRQGLASAAKQGTRNGLELEMVRKDGSAMPALLNLAAAPAGAGETLIHANLFDITERKKLEEQFRQAQKMEAVGRLAGGIAHDFNNLLTIVVAGSELLLNDMGPDDPRREDLEEIWDAGERGESLTRQLLAFSRKQVLQPRIIDLNALIASTSTMLRRVVGEDIEVVSRLEPNLAKVTAYPGQIQQVILNLAVNSRDAMALGGKILIETANFEVSEEQASRLPDLRPGPHVSLAVSDTGHGMDHHTLSHIFEPFFTTKPPGSGTGLGLATVYGIVQQTAGSITVVSELGKGSRFDIILPAAAGQGAEGAPAASAVEPAGGTETILLVEDDRALGALIAKGLRRYGYTVLVAGDALDAIRIAGQHQGSIHLLLSDLVMPQMSGLELAARLKPIRPAMKTLFISGYPNHINKTALQGPFHFLQKPFATRGLAGKVREALDAADE